MISHCQGRVGLVEYFFFDRGWGGGGVESIHGLGKRGLDLGVGVLHGV